MSDATQSIFRLLLVGVGGQGCVTAARALGDAAVASERGARIGELHGMSQRGGSVEASVVIGPGRSAMIGPAQADVVVGLEPVETWRALGRMSGRTHVLMNTGRIVPAMLTHQGQQYPELAEIEGLLRAVTPHVLTVDGSRLAQEAGLPRAENVLMLGALVALGGLPFTREALFEAVVARSPARFADDNRKAFEIGAEAAESLGCP